MSARFSLIFFQKKSKNYQGGPIPIYMRVSMDSRRTEISTKRRWDPACWNAAAGRAFGIKEHIRELNAYLDALQNKVYQAHRKLVESGKDLTIQNLKNIIEGKKDKSKMLLEVFQEHNDRVAELVTKDYASGTLVRYTTAFRHTQGFIKWRYNTDDIEISKLSYEFAVDFEFWLKTVRKCCHNTSIKYVSNMKKIVNICLKNGWLLRDPFLSYRMSKKEVVREILTEEEIQVVLRKSFPTDRLNNVRDVFLFSCFTGLAYADIKKLKAVDIITGIDGSKWISTQRQKTETISKIPLLSTALDILNKYRDHPRCIIENTVLPTPSNQKLNAYLREIADLCGIHKELTFHCARHTFATTVTLTNGVPIETVSKMLGHRNLKTTQHYAKILDRKISEDMLTLKQKFGNKFDFG